MRVWLVDDRRGDDPGSLEALLSQLANRPDSGFRLLGTGPLGPDSVGELRAQQPEVLVVNEPAWPDNSGIIEMLGFEPSLVIATTTERSTRFHPLAERYCVWFIPASPGLECLWLALLAAFAAHHRQAQSRLQMARL